MSARVTPIELKESWISIVPPPLTRSPHWTMSARAGRNGGRRRCRAGRCRPPHHRGRHRSSCEHGSALIDTRSREVGVEEVIVVIASSLVGLDFLRPTIGTHVRVDRRDRHPIGSRRRKDDHRPTTKLPISTICAPAPSSAARSWRRRAWSSVIQPSTSATDARMSEKGWAIRHDGEASQRAARARGTPSIAAARRRTRQRSPTATPHRRHGSRRRSPCGRRRRARRVDAERKIDQHERAPASSGASTERTITTPGTADRKRLPSIRSRVTTTWSAMIGLPTTAEMHVGTCCAPHEPGSWRSSSTSEKAAGPS